MKVAWVQDAGYKGNWFQDYTPKTITAELEAGGFKVQGLWGDLTGAPFQEDSEWIGVVAQKTPD